MKSHPANPRPRKSITLVELLIAIVLIGMIVLGLHSIELFSRFHIIASDRQAKLQNEIAYVLEHMSKKMLNAVGNTNATDPGQRPIATNSIEVDNTIQIRTDTNSNGQRDSGDKQIAYRYRAPDYQIWYYSNYTDCLDYADPSCYEVITHKIIRPDFSTDTTQPTHFTYSSSNNYLDLQITACWDPDGDPNACGTPDNPSITMRARINMPSASTN